MMQESLKPVAFEPVPELHYSLLLETDEPDQFEQHVANTADFGANQPLFLALVPPEGTILDLGANIGTHAIPWAASGRTVIAYEALRANADRLRLAAELNALSNLHVRHRAAWDRRTSLRMAGVSAWGRVSAAGEELVEAVDLDSEELPTDRVDGIKIDIEGAELFALRGMVRLLDRDHPHVIFESNGIAMQSIEGATLGGVRDLLKHHGYSLYRIYERKLAPDCMVQEAIICDYLATTMPPEELAGATRFQVAPMTTGDLSLSIRAQDRFFDQHRMHVLAIPPLLPWAVRLSPTVAALLLKWRSRFAGQDISHFRRVVADQK